MLKDILPFAKFLIEHYKISIKIVMMFIVTISLFVTKPGRKEHLNYIENSRNQEINKENMDNYVKYNDIFLFTTFSYNCGDTTKVQVIIDKNGHGRIRRFDQDYLGFDESERKLISVCSGIFTKYLTVGFFGKIIEMAKFDDILYLVNKRKSLYD